MKLILLFLSAFTLTNCFAQPKNYEGIWEGEMEIGIKLRIVFHFSKDTKGDYTTKMDSPDQSAFGMPTDYTYVRNDSIFTGIERFQISFAGKLIDDTTMNGSFKQAAAVPLMLKKVIKVSKLKRPQTPTAPFPYATEDVTYSSGKIVIAGTLSYPNPKPNQKQKLPAVLLITGSGPQNRDEEIMEHKSFAVIADHLTKKGFIVLRVDDRGTGKTTGNFASATSADFAKDVEGGIHFLKARKEVDMQKIGLLGHSEGGMIAQIVAAKRKDINFLILMAAPGIKPIDLMTEQNLAIFETMGIGKKARNAYGSLYKPIALAAVTAKDSTSRMLTTAKVLNQWLFGKDSSILKELGLETKASQKGFLENINSSFAGPWYKYFLNYDPAPNLKKINAKVLAINGDRDVQVLSESNLAGIKAGLKKTKAVYEVHTIKGVNHLFQTCKTCMVNEYGILEETISPKVLELIGEWMEREVRGDHSR